MSVDLAELGLSVDSKGFVRGQKDMENFQKSADRTEKTSSSLIATLRLLAAAAASLQLVKYANEWTDLNSRILNAVKSQEAAEAVMSSISNTARNTYSSLQQTADSFLQNNLVLTDLGYTTAQQIKFSEALNNSLVISGSKGQGAATALGALGRVMAEGTIKSSEFNLLMTYSSRTVQALADGLGVSTLKLREMVAAGEVTGAKIFDALSSQLEKLNQEAEAMPATIGDALLQVDNAFLRLIGTINETSGFSERVASPILSVVDAINEFSDSLDPATVAYYFDTIENAAISLAAVIGTRMVSSYTMAIAASLRSAQTIRLETAAYAEAAVIAAKSAAEKQAQAVASIKSEQALSAARINSLRSVQAQIAAEISLEKTRYAAQINDIGRAKTVNRMAALGVERANVSRQIAAAESAQIATASRLTAAQAAQLSSSSALSSANARLAASTAALGVASRAAAAGLALLGGPLGVVLLAATAFAVLSTRVDESDYAILNINGTLDEAIKKFEQMTEAQRAFAELSLQNKIDEDRRKIEELQESINRVIYVYDQFGNKHRIWGMSNDDIIKNKSLIDDLTASIEQNQAKLSAFADIAPAWMLNLARSIDTFAESQRKLAEDGSAETISENYTKLAQDIERRIALFGKQGEAAAFAYDLEKELIKDVTDAQAEYLLGRYKYLESITAEENVRKSLDEMFEREDKYRKDKQESVSETIRALEQEVIALEIGEVAYLAYSLALQGASEEEIRTAVAARQRAIEIRKTANEVKKFEEETKGFGSTFSSTFDGIFESIIDGSEDAYDVVLKGFKSLLISMAKEALFNPILVKVGQENVGGAASSAASSNSGGAASGLLAGGWWAAIAAAVVVGVGEHNKNQAKKFDQISAEIRQASQFTGTILGAANQKSESLGNSIDDLVGLGSDTLGVNRDQYRALIDIRQGLAGVAAGFARSIAFNPGVTVTEGTSLGINKNPLTAASIRDELGIKFDPISAPFTNFILDFGEGLTNKIAKEIVKKKTKVTDTGISIIGDSLAGILEDGVIQAFNYADVQTTKKVLGITTSNKMKTTEEAIGEEFNRQITSVFENAGKSLGIASATFGLDIQDFANRLVVDTQRISLKDLSADEITQELEYFLSSNLDKWAQIIIGNTGALEKYQNAGEGAFETMIRLSSQAEYLVDALEQINLEIPATGIAAIDLVQEIASLAGGFEQLQSSLSAYYDKFFSDQEKLENMTGRLSEVTQGLLQTLPTTREEFRAIVESLDLTTESGAKAFAELISVSGAIDQYITALDRQNAALKSAAQTALTSLQNAINAQRSAAQGVLDRASSAKDALDKALDAERARLAKQNQDAIAAINAQRSAQTALGNVQVESLKQQRSIVEQNISDMTSLASKLRSTVGSIAEETDDLLRSRYFAAANQISAAAAGGSTENIGQAIDVVSKTDPRIFRSQFERDYQTALLQNQMLNLADLTEEQISEEEKLLQSIDRQIASAEAYYQSSLNAIDAQIAAANDAYQAQIDSLDEMAAAALSQLNALLGIDDSVMSLEEAFAAFKEATKNAEGIYDEIQLLDELARTAQLEYDAVLGVGVGINYLTSAVENFSNSLYAAVVEGDKPQLEALNNIAFELRATREQQMRDNQRTEARLAAIENATRSSADELEFQRRTSPANV